MKPSILLVLVGALVAGCTERAKLPLLKPVDAHYGIYLARTDIRTTITPDGLLRRVRTDNKSYGPNDKVVEQVEIRQGQLTRKQSADLTKLFDGWDRLSDKPYARAPDDAEIEIRYGDKTVSGGNDLPWQAKDVMQRINQLADSMPIIPK